GRRYNMVPDYAKAMIHIKGKIDELESQFQSFLKNNQLKGKWTEVNGNYLLEVEGISAHGMEPDKGRNAGLYLAKFLSELSLDSLGKNYFTFVSRYFYNDSRGMNLGIAYHDDITGDLTINVGKLSYQKE